MIDLYTFATPNGRKISIALEELGLPYEVHVINIGAGDQFKPDYVAINPNSKIPAIVDRDGPGGGPFTVFESGAILLYLAEKTGKLLPADPRARSEAIQWLMFQMSGVAPSLGQLNHFAKAAPEKLPYAIKRFFDESRRVATVLDQRLAKWPYLAGEEYSVADIATYPWIASASERAPEVVAGLEHLKGWLARVCARDAVGRGMSVPVLSK